MSFLTSAVLSGSAIPDGGVSRWEFEQDVTDSWGANDGTDNTSAGYSANASIGNYAKEFDGSDDYVALPSSVSDPIQDTTEWTVSGWVYSDNYDSGAAHWLAFGDGAQLELKTNQDGPELRATTNDGSNFFDLYGPTPSNGVYYMFTVTYNPSGQWKLYIDATEEASDSAPDMQDFGSSNRIGSKFDNRNYYQGLVDDIRIYEKTLTATEVSNLYNTGSISG